MEAVRQEASLLKEQMQIVKEDIKRVCSCKTTGRASLVTRSFIFSRVWGRPGHLFFGACGEGLGTRLHVWESYNMIIIFSSSYFSCHAFPLHDGSAGHCKYSIIYKQ